MRNAIQAFIKRNRTAYKATGVVVSECLSIAKRLQNRVGRQDAVLRRGATRLVLGSFSPTDLGQVLQHELVEDNANRKSVNYDATRTDRDCGYHLPWC